MLEPGLRRSVLWMLALSGAAALLCEIIWMRRVALLGGSTGLALTTTLSVYMGGLGIGSLVGGRVRSGQGLRAYGMAELIAAGWILAIPGVLDQAALLSDGFGMVGRAACLSLPLLPAAIMHGVSLPALRAELVDGRALARAYTMNTLGAMGGLLAGAFFLIPAAGVRQTELMAAALAAVAGIGALQLAGASLPVDRPTRPRSPAPLPMLLAAAVSGAVALALEVCWSRVGAMLLGGSVYAMALVLAAFLGALAIGAELGRRRGPGAWRGGLGMLGLSLIPALLAWRVLPYAVGAAFPVVGPGLLLPVGALLLALSMAPTPIASGLVLASLFSAAPSGSRAAGQLMAANTLGCVVGSATAGLVGLPLLGLQNTALTAAFIAILTSAAALFITGRTRVAGVLLLAPLTLPLLPSWDAALYSVGLGLRVADFVDLSPRAIDRFAREGWDLVFYRDGQSATVAVGESTRTGNLWLSLNGKVDASTGGDMPTQLLSGELPVHIIRGRHPSPATGIVGLASGVTARAALEAGASSVTVVELEPAVVEAAAYFAQANHHLLEDPRATVIIDDARAWLARPGPRYPVLISEPSNPWITGVSNLFTVEYWSLTRERLAEDGVICQWIQLYALPPKAFKSLVRSFTAVYPDAWLFESIPGADALLIASATGLPPLPDDLSLRPTLGPAQLRQLSTGAPLNTDNRPWVEFEAPKWLHRNTGRTNRALIEAAAAGGPPR